MLDPAEAFLLLAVGRSRLTDTCFQQIFTSWANLISFVLLIGKDTFVPQLL